MTSTRAREADALEIEAGAKRRLADEYDAAQERGEIRSANERTASQVEAVGAADIGLTHKQVHEARQIRDAEVMDPGIVRRTLDDRLERGEEPNKAALKFWRKLRQNPFIPIFLDPPLNKAWKTIEGRHRSPQRVIGEHHADCGSQRAGYLK